MRLNVSATHSLQPLPVGGSVGMNMMGHAPPNELVTKLVTKNPCLAMTVICCMSISSPMIARIELIKSQTRSQTTHRTWPNRSIFHRTITISIKVPFTYPAGDAMMEWKTTPPLPYVPNTEPATMFMFVRVNGQQNVVELLGKEFPGPPHRQI